MANFTQPSFSSGELSPAAYGRIDLAKYLTGLKTCRNFITRVHGGVVNRPGTEFIAEVVDSNVRGRFIPFIFSETQAYVLDFGASNLRFLSNGGLVLGPNKSIAPDTANPPVFTSAAHGYFSGDQVFVTGTNMPTLNGRFWTVINVTLNTFQLTGVNIPGVVGVGTVARVVRITSPYAETDLPTVKYVQRRDVMTLALGGVVIPPKELSRLANDSWTFGDTVHEEGPFQDVNSVTSNHLSISAVTGSITITADFSFFIVEYVGQLIYIEQLNHGVPWEVGKAVAVNDIRTSGGKYYKALDAANTGTVRPIGETVGENESDGNVRWEYIHSGYGIALITAFTDDHHVTATVQSHSQMPTELITVPSYKWALGAWGGTQGFPAVVTYYQQRKTFASTPNKPEGLWFSGSNAYTFFGKSQPIVDDDAISMQLVGDRVSSARHLLQLGKLIALTQSNKWIIPDSDTQVTLTPIQKSGRQQGQLGASHVVPITVEDAIVYVLDKSQTVQDLAYEYVSNIFAGNDISILSKHLFEGYTILAAAYQHVPFQVIWFVRSDGALVSCTYLRKQEVWGWHRHDTQGIFEDVCVIPEGTEDRVYFRVRRNVGGVPKRYIERLTSRLYTDIRDAFFVDSGLKYDGRNTNTTMLLAISVITTPVNTYDVYSSGAYFTSDHIGDEIHFPYVDPADPLNPRVLKFRITGITSSTIAQTSAPGLIIPVAMQNFATSNWIRAKSIVKGFYHLIGLTVSILADGEVHPQKVIASDGSLTLDRAAGVIIAGLPYLSDFETLNLNNPSQGSILDKEKCVFAVRLLVESSRGIFAGPDANHLDEFAQRDTEGYSEPVDLLTGLASIRVDSTWEPGGRVFVRQVDPLPLSIIGVMPDVDIGGAK